MFEQLQVSTPEGVTFKHDLAGAGSRSIATAIDLVIFVAVMVATVVLLSLGMTFIGPFLGFSFGDLGALFATFIWLISFAFLWGYRTVMETRYSGSVGYRVMDLKVVTHRGAKPLFWQCAVRGLLWPLECVYFAIIAFVSIIMTKRSQRLGDLITGTLVVHGNKQGRLGTLQVQEAALDPNAPFRTWELSQVSDDEVYLIRRFLDRRVNLPGDIRLHLANKLYAMIWPKISGVPSNWYAEAVLEGIAASRSVANER
jgi:uncharacterized RDD family membrane protein YckC